MIVNGRCPTVVTPAPENNGSAHANLGDADATGFSALLFLILAAPQPAINAALSEGEGSGNVGASLALSMADGSAALESTSSVPASLSMADDQVSFESIGSNPAVMGGTNGINQASEVDPSGAKSKGDSPLIPDNTKGQSEVSSGKVIALGLTAEPDGNWGQVISGLASDHGNFGLQPGQQIHVGQTATAGEKNESVSMVDPSDQPTSELPGNASGLFQLENTVGNLNRTKKSPGAAPDATISERETPSEAVAAKIFEQSEPRPVKALARGHIAKAENNSDPVVADLALDRPDGVNPGPKFGQQIHVGTPTNGETAEAEINSFTSDPKAHESPDISRDAAQPPNETATSMVRSTLLRDGSSPAGDASASAWRPVVERVAGEIVGQIKMNKQEAIIQLDPPELVKIRIDLHVEGDKLQAHIFTEAHESRALIENHLQELRQALQSNNFDLVDVRINRGDLSGTAGDLMQGFHQQTDGREEWAWSSGSPGNTASDSTEPRRPENSLSQKGRVSMWA